MKDADKEKVVNWDNLSKNLDELNIDGVLNGEDSNQHIVATEEEFQELLKGLFE